MKSDTLGRCKFSRNSVFLKNHFVVSGQHDFIVVGELRLIRIHSLRASHVTSDRHHGNPRKLPRMNVTEAANVFIAVKITRLPRPFGLRVGT